MWSNIDDLNELYINLNKSDAREGNTVTLDEKQVLPDNYVDFVGVEEVSAAELKPFLGKLSRISLTILTEKRKE